MNELTLRPVDHVEQEPLYQLNPVHAALVAERAQRPAASIGIDLPVVAVTDPPPPRQLFRSETGSWWVASSFESDPAYLTRGATYAPQRVVRQLDALIEAGVEFDQIYLLDELPADWSPDQPVPEMRPVEEQRSRQVVAAQEMTYALAIEAAAGLFELAKTAGRGAAIAGKGLGVGTGAAVLAVASYDPVILGGVTDRESGKVAWCLIDQWDEVPSP